MYTADDPHEAFGCQRTWEVSPTEYQLKYESRVYRCS